jgi:hypothetical protein
VSVEFRFLHIASPIASPAMFVDDSDDEINIIIQPMNVTASHGGNINSDDDNELDHFREI